MAPSLLSRLFGPPSRETLALEPKRLLPAEITTGSIGLETKSPFGLLPQGAYGQNYIFFSPDGGQTFVDVGTNHATILAFIAYWYIATRWRAQKIAEAPLMVAVEDQEDGTEDWIPDHELVPLLEEPSPDYDMGELLEITSNYLDNTGACLWVKDYDRGKRIARLTPFSRNEFVPKRDESQLYATFDITTMEGMRAIAAEDACFFRDAHVGSNMVESSWGRGRSRLDIALSWLKLGAKAQQTVYDLLANSVWPSIVVTPDKDWDPDPTVYAQYKQNVEKYARGGNKGKPFIALGGGTVTSLASTIKDLVPNDILNRVESVVSAISGVPAIVLQFQVGLENSPWSHMVQARRMAYEDVVAPSWRKIERVLKRQLLTPVDDDPTHYIRFDRTNIDSLQRDQLESVQIATTMGDMATLNERRAVMGLEPSNDPKADEIPELTKPSILDILAAQKPPASSDSASSTSDPAASSGDRAASTSDSGASTSDAAASTSDRAGKYLALVQRKMATSSLLATFRAEAITVWSFRVHAQLETDAAHIADIVSSFLTDAVHKSIATKARGKDRAMGAVSKYLNEDSRRSWAKLIQPLAAQAVTRAGAVVGADLNINFNLINANLLKFAAAQTGQLITNVSGTTKQLVSNIVQGGLDASATTEAIATLIRDATAFDKSRALLIARTEVARDFNGAPTEALAEYGAETGRSFTKTWSGVLDERERDEHLDMEGETVPIDEPFSNGMDYPDDYNERCTLIYDDVSGD